jgi:hypothetical protein
MRTGLRHEKTQTLLSPPQLREEDTTTERNTILTLIHHSESPMPFHALCGA